VYSMKKIAFFIPDLGGAGAERVVSNLSIALSKHNYEVYIILYNEKEIAYEYGGKIITLDKEKRDYKVFGKIFRFINRTIELKRVKKRYNFDIVISFLENPDFQNILTKGTEKVYISVRNFASKSYALKKKLLAKLLYKKADLVIAVSKEIRDDLAKNFHISKDKIKVIYNPYDIDKVNALAKETVEEKYKKLFEKKVIINAGRLTYQKGQWHLIRAFSWVCSEVKDAELVLLGEGPLKLQMEELATKLNIYNKVHFIGFQDNPYKYMKNSALYVLTSLFEGFPNALVEAMVCGLPIISANCKSGPKEILGSYNYSQQYGVLTDEFDSEMDIESVILSKEEKKLALEICSLLKDEDVIESFKQKSLKRASDFEASKIIEKWLEIL